jgi:general secretion pathway protein N
MSRGRLFLLLAVGALVYLGVLVATFPAPWVSHMVEMASQRKLVLRDPAGTAWNGSGRLYARQRSGALVDLGPVRWTASPATLLAGKLGGELTVAEKTMQVEASPSSVTVRRLDVQFPGALLAGFAPELAAVGADGLVRVRSDSLRVESDSLLGLAEIEWRGLRLARAQDLDLGSHVARLRGGGAKVDVELASLEGPLKLTGGGTWTRSAGLVVSGSAEARAANVAPFLRSVCAEYRDSRCNFRYSSS